MTQVDNAFSNAWIKRGEVYKKPLKAATPELPTKNITSNDEIKIATSNLFMSNQPQVQIDELTRTLFANINSRELFTLTTSAQAWNQYQIPAINNNMTDSFEVSKTYNSSTILTLTIPVLKSSNILNGSSLSISSSSTQATINTPYVSSYTKVQLQTISVGKVQTSTKYP